MAANSITIEKNPKLKPSEDYFLLRRKGIEFIEQMGSKWWTDYNSHDPGITILEALCYAITDLGYRTDWDLEDILAEPPGSESDPQTQPFFTARDILTVNPLTTSDFRRVLVDLDRVRNAWLICKKCACEVHLYADCEADCLAYEQPLHQKSEIKVAPAGAYDVLLELEDDPELGDLNDRKVRHTFVIEVAPGKRGAVTAEFRFPEWDAVAWGLATDYISEEGKWLRTIDKLHLELEASLIKRGEEDPLTNEEKMRRWKQWDRVFFARVKIVFDSSPAIEMWDIPLRLFAATETRQAFMDAWDLSNFEKSEFAGGVAESFIKKAAMVERTLAEVKDHLHDRRNLCEDFCCMSRIGAEDVAVCADIEVTPDADIEQVLANVLFEIEQYFNPGIKFYTLQELMDEGLRVEEIFEGPPLEHGFVKKADLDSAQLKSQLRTSDIINRLVEIKGVIAIESLLLTLYGQDGRAVKGASDSGQGADKEKSSASWTLAISDNCQPRLYVENSKFIFYKNGLPFMARAAEVQDTLSQLRGQNERLKRMDLAPGERDLPVPAGVYRSPKDYYPVQYSFPLTYGIGPDGLPEPPSAGPPSIAAERRRAQARQLKGYLMVFEQLLANYLAQLANVRNLFSLYEKQAHTYFAQNLRHDALIRDVEALLRTELDDDKLLQLAESEPEWLDRRNRFLDHLMGRFAESFSDYTLMLYSLGKELKPVAQKTLIGRKIALLKNYPAISRERARSFNYRKSTSTQAVLRKRIALMLGIDPQIEDQIIIVEHLLLRPKFPGDALMEVCLGKGCSSCGEADPYSFQLTVVMPGWAAPFDENIELRRFAERTIRLETPSHLLGKICWVSNLAYGEGLEKNLTTPLRRLLLEKGKTADDASPSESDAGSAAEKILAGAHQVFVNWVESGGSKGLIEDKVKAALKDEFQHELTLDEIYVGAKDQILDMLAAHFTRISAEDRCLQYDRFKEAWGEWLVANAQFDWCNERVAEKIELGLGSLQLSLKNAPTGKPLACRIAERFGTCFSQELKEIVLSEEIVPDWKKRVGTIFDLAFHDGEGIADVVVTSEPKGLLREAFSNIYSRYCDVTLKLWRVVLQLARLQSIYPPATLHDCDEGSDENPVRLGNTVLGG